MATTTHTSRVSVNDTSRLATFRGMTREAWTLVAICALAVVIVAVAFATRGDEMDNYARTVLALFAVGFTVCGTFVAVMDWHEAEMSRHSYAWNVRYDIDGENLDRMGDLYRQSVAEYATMRNDREALRASHAIVTAERDALSAECDALRHALALVRK